MVHRITRSNGKFKVAEYSFQNIYFDCVINWKTYCYCHVQIEDSLAYVHLYFEQFGGDVVREMKKDQKIIISMLKRIGVTKVLGTHVMEEADKWIRFVALLGFNNPHKMQMPETGEDVMVVVMEV